MTTFHGQFTNDTLNYIDDLTIGSRYTVRGFDGETMLAAERGFYWRNELQVPIEHTGQFVYGGIDYGHVFGPNTAFLAGTQLAGTVVGLPAVSRVISVRSVTTCSQGHRCISLPPSIQRASRWDSN